MFVFLDSICFPGKRVSMPRVNEFLGQWGETVLNRGSKLWRTRKMYHRTFSHISWDSYVSKVHVVLECSKIAPICMPETHL